MEFLHATRVLAEFLRVEPINTMEVWVYTYKKPAENPAFVRCGCPNQRRDVQKLRRCPVQPGRPSSSGPAPVGIQPLGCPRWPTAVPRVLAVVPAPARHDPEDPRQIDVAGVELVGVPHQEAPKGPLRHVVALAHGRPGKASVGIGGPQLTAAKDKPNPAGGPTRFSRAHPMFILLQVRMVRTGLTSILSHGAWGAVWRIPRGTGRRVPAADEPPPSGVSYRTSPRRLVRPACRLG